MGVPMQKQVLGQLALLVSGPRAVDKTLPDTSASVAAAQHRGLPGLRLTGCPTLQGSVERVPALPGGRWFVLGVSLRLVVILAVTLVESLNLSETTQGQLVGRLHAPFSSEPLRPIKGRAQELCFLTPTEQAR